MAKFRKKPVVVEAVQWTGANLDEVLAFCDEGQRALWIRSELIVLTLEGELCASIGDWIVRGVRNEYYPCKPDIFEATYGPWSPGPDWA
jgi:hypothetical protein